MSEPKILTWTALLTELARTPADLRSLLAEVPPDVVCGHSAADQRSACDILAHMCAIESPYRARLARIVLEDNPRVAIIDFSTGGYDPETPISILLDTFARLRADTLAFIRALPLSARVRPAIHAELGPITLRGQVESLLVHDREHLAQIGGLIERQRRDDVKM